jgi:hypothetical protein
VPRLQRERQEELDEFAGPYVGRYNVVGRRAWWQNRDIDDVLQEHGYMPPPRAALLQALNRRQRRQGHGARP